MLSDSPFNEHLQTNYVPSCIDIRHVRRLLLEPEAELSSLNSQLSHLKRQLDNSKTERDDLEEGIEEHYRLLAPFRCLPDDMLREIFLWCLPDHHEAMMSVEEPPLVLGRVCKRWKVIVYRTPRLWASLHISLPFAPSFERALSSPPTPLEIIEKATFQFEVQVQLHQRAISEWLYRSGSCRLSISIHPYIHQRRRRRTRPLTHAKVESYINLVFAFSHRLRNLDITVPNGELSGLIASIPVSSFPVLRVLRIMFPLLTTHDQWMNSGLFNAKHLSALKLDNFPHHISVTEVDWSQLTHLAVSGEIDIQDTQKIFTRCTRVVYCSINVSDTRTNFSTSTPLSLPHLETLLLIDGSTGPALANLLEYLDAPSLRAISYHFMSWPSSGHSPLLTLLSRNGSHIERLTTDVQFYTLEDLVLCFELLPFLTHFTIEVCPLGISDEQASNRPYLPINSKLIKATLDLLAPDGSNPTPCRRLQVLNLNLRFMSGSHLSDTDLLGFIQQRMRAAEAAESDIASLTSVTFTSLEVMEADIRPFLQQYIEDGMKLDLSYRPPIPLMISPGFFSPRNGLLEREKEGVFYV
ncbi:hypothetical protein BDZ97DRAFT_2078204 [Flammula alnicola]|nr:hypothetical protein BDZ97DRAFT_2078204 [Flammula alnicola]